jgi:hypothetical protein
MLLSSRGKTKILEVMDPLGEKLETYNLDLPVHFKNYRIVESRTPVQSPSSATCGYHCLFVLYNRLKGRSLTEIMTHVYRPNDLSFNDKLARTFFLSLCIRAKRRKGENTRGMRCQSCRPIL